MTHTNRAYANGRYYNDGLFKWQFKFTAFVVSRHILTGGEEKSKHDDAVLVNFPCKAANLLLAGSQFLELRIGMEVINGRQTDSQGQRAFCNLMSNTCTIYN